jgi:methyltransferase (TIGR00027 family)
VNKGQSSLTAEGIAFIRAWESLKPAGERVCDDPLARHFIAPLMWVLGKLFNGIKQRSAPGVAEFPIGRCRFIDDYLQARLAEGIEQLVILGAGFDSRAYRFEGLRGKVRVFEVDHPATQRVKRQRLERALGHIPDHVVFVPVDLLVERLDQRLLESGYDPGLKTLFIWEGVTQYLDPQAVDSTLAFVAHHSAPGSALVFDYIEREALETSDKRPEVRTMERARRISGEGLTAWHPARDLGSCRRRSARRPEGENPPVAAAAGSDRLGTPASTDSSPPVVLASCLAITAIGSLRAPQARSNPQPTLGDGSVGRPPPPRNDISTSSVSPRVPGNPGHSQRRRWRRWAPAQTAAAVRGREGRPWPSARRFGGGANRRAHPPFGGTVGRLQPRHDAMLPGSAPCCTGLPQK